MQPRQRIARIGRADDGADLLAVDQLLHVLNGFGRCALVVANDADHLAAQNAARLVDVLDRGFEAPAPGNAKLRYATGGLIGRVANLDVLCLRTDHAPRAQRAHHQLANCLLHLRLLN